MAEQSTNTGTFLAGLLTAAVLGLPHASVAAEFMSVDAMRAAISTALEPRLGTYNNAMVEVSVGAIDPRLRLPACPALDVELPPVTTAMMTAKLDCRNPTWAIYVPVRLHAWVEAVVASVNLVPNTQLDAGDLTSGRVDMFANAGGLLTEPAQAEGKILRVGLPAGSPILSPFLEFPIVVHHGQQVLLTLTTSTMTIEAPALALEDGRIGDSIEVENPDSKKTMRVTVLSDGSVEMKF